MGRNVLKSSLQNASFSIVFQIFCRCITFGINAFIVRSVGRDVLGIMNVRLLLLESTLLFLSREAIIRASLSSTTQSKNKCTWPQLINQLWITVPICIVLSIPCFYIWINMLSPVDDIYYKQYKFGCLSIIISCIIELCAEVPIFLSQVFCFVKIKVILDTLHIFVRSIIFITLVLYNNNLAIYAFSFAQLISIGTIVLGNYIFYYFYIKNLLNYRKKDGKIKNHKYYEHMEDFPVKNLKEMLPFVLENENNHRFNKDLYKLIMSFMKQGVLKQILTEGEKYVMSISPVLTFSEQATYDVVNNLGSLAARFIFRPIEDSSYFYFTQTIARDIKLIDQNKEKITEASNVLRNVCKGVTSIGILAFVFGQSYAETILYIYGGENFIAGGLPEMLLKWHCLSIVLLAVNGITEGYMFATNTSKQIDSYNYYMAIFSVTFLLLSYQLTSIFGPVGLVLANCLNMFCRIFYSLFYIKNQFNTVNMNPLQGLVPGRCFIVTILIMGILCKISEIRIRKYSIIYHLLIGVLCTLITITVWCFENRSLLKIGYDKYKKEKKH